MLMPWATATGLLCLLLTVGAPALIPSDSKSVATKLNAPDAFLSQLQPCPAKCTSHNSDDWTVYSSFNRLSHCHDPLLFDFAIYNPVNDSSKTLKFRACTAVEHDESSPAAKSANESPYDSNSIREFKAMLKFNQGGTSSKSTGNQVDVALESLQSYLRAGADLTKDVMLGYYEGVVVGAYVGEAFGKDSAPSVIDRLLSQEKSSAPAVSLTQLCGDSRDRHHVLGIAVSPTGDLATVQAALVSWSKGECATGIDKVTKGLPSVNIWEVPQNNGGNTHPSSSAVSSTPSPRHHHNSHQRHLDLHARHLIARDTKYCEKRTVVSGDTCTSLAKACGVTIGQFKQYNTDDICDKNLLVDQKVCCTSGFLKPQPYENGTCYTYKTKSQDNCYDLSVAWSVTQDEIADFNDGSTWGWNGCDDLGAGINICLSKGDAPLPAVIPNAVCGPQAPGTSIDGSITDAAELADLNPCPLNSCCNIWGHCGIDASFCTESKGPTGNPGTSKPDIYGCVSNCGIQIVNNDEKPSAGFQRVGYYETFNWNRDCLNMRAEWSNTLNYTHMHWAFGGIGEDMSVYINDTYKQWQGFIQLQDIQKVVSFGGWGFSTEGPTYDILRRAMEPENRDTFVSNVVSFAIASGVDGIDIDWEYPGAPDIPGIPPGLHSDAPNYLATLQALRKALPEQYTLSIAAPASYWYLKAFPIAEMAEVLDYIVYMAYDLHGQWDYGNSNAQSGCESGNCLRSHVNETEVRLTLSMVTKAGVKANKIMVGESSYGRSFKMAEAGCTGPDCLFTGSNGTSDARKGRCTNTGGYLANAEIKEIIAKGGDSVETWYDDETGTDYLVYDDTEWVGYMNAYTKDFRRENWRILNFAGTIDWAVDLQDFNVADTVGATGDYDEDSEISVFSDMIWEWENPVIEAVVGHTNLIQASPLETTVTRTAYTTLTMISGTSLSTTVVSTAFPISEVNYQPFTLASTDTESSSILTYTPIPRVTPDPMSFSVSQGWTVTSPSGSLDGPEATVPTIVSPPNTASTATTTTTTSTDEDGFLMWITWSPTLGYNLPSIITPKIPAPTRIPDDENDPIPTPDPVASDCLDSSCTTAPDCTSSDCTRGGDCTGPNCISGGSCHGENCIRGGTCVGDNCEKGGDCEGDECISGGGCSGSKCRQGGGCSGNKCNRGGGCRNTLFTKCSSGGCTIGPCHIDLDCPGCDNQIVITVKPDTGNTPKPACLDNCPKLPPCAGGGSDCNQPCNAKRCPAPSMPTGKPCTSVTTVDLCTEIISSTATQTAPVTSYSTATRTRCEKTADCDAVDQTITTTVTTDHEPDPTVSATGILEMDDNNVEDQAVFDALADAYEEWERTAEVAPTTSTTTITVPPPTTTTTNPSGPYPTEAEGCSLMNGIQGVCFSKCDPDTNQPISEFYEEGDPWCWLRDSETDIGAFCNNLDDCPSEFTCQPEDWGQGGCHIPEVISSGCALMNGIQGVCWSKCDPATSELVDSYWHEGDPWCWLEKDDVGAFCNYEEDCPASGVHCQPDDWEKGGCYPTEGEEKMMKPQGSSRFAGNGTHFM